MTLLEMLYLVNWLKVLAQTAQTLSPNKIIVISLKKKNQPFYDNKFYPLWLYC